ncbi:MAG: YheU family protein [Myxococcales bacterium]|nr:YheU family protein [Myxococcales bacterium]
MAKRAEPVRIPVQALDEETLRGLVESFVNREGTDYGRVEQSFEAKVADVMHQLERGEAEIVFDPETESVTILPL